MATLKVQAAGCLLRNADSEFVTLCDTIKHFHGQPDLTTMIAQWCSPCPRDKIQAWEST